MAFMEISIVPIGTKTTSLSKYIADIIRLLEESELKFALNDMGTTIHGPIDQLFDIAKKLHDVPFQKGAKRVYTVIKIDDRRDKRSNLGDKKSSVLKKL